LRRHWIGGGHGDEITRRMDAAAARRFPVALQEAHIEKIIGGEVGQGTLAWMLGVHPDDLDVDAPSSPPELGLDELVDILGS
jgi:hypothetical protein